MAVKPVKNTHVKQKMETTQFHMVPVNFIELRVAPLVPLSIPLRYNSIHQKANVSVVPQTSHEN